MLESARESRSAALETDDGSRSARTGAILPAEGPPDGAPSASNPGGAAKDPGLGIGPASRELGLHPRTLMAYERIGLVRPLRRSRRRIYSRNELRWLACVQELNRPGGVGLRGLSVLRRFVPCWAIREQVEGDAERGREPRAAESLGRLARAYAGVAPVRCRDCEVYKAGNAETKAAWNAEIARER